MTARDVVVAVLMLAGATFALLASIGLQRFGSVFARMHAATKAATLGLLLAVAAAAIRLDDVGSRTKLILAGAMQLITAPIAAHMVSRAAYRAGTELNPKMEVDELAGADVDDLHATADHP